MSNRVVKNIITASAGVALLLYPFVVYYGLNNFSPFLLALILLTLLSLRLIMMKKQLNKMPWILPATLLGAVGIIVSMFSDSYLGFKLYPLMMNLAMLIVFAYSYLKQPTVIETFARLTEPQLSPAGVRYTTKVTLIWCLFFLLNGSISLYTALYASIEVWTLYNGLLSYFLMGLLMGIEFLVRLKVKKHHKSSQTVEEDRTDV